MLGTRRQLRLGPDPCPGSRSGPLRHHRRHRYYCFLAAWALIPDKATGPRSPRGPDKQREQEQEQAQLRRADDYGGWLPALLQLGHGQQVDRVHRRCRRQRRSAHPVQLAQRCPAGSSPSTSIQAGRNAVTSGEARFTIDGKELTAGRAKRSSCPPGCPIPRKPRTRRDLAVVELRPALRARQFPQAVSQATAAGNGEPRQGARPATRSSSAPPSGISCRKPRSPRRPSPCRTSSCCRCGRQPGSASRPTTTGATTDPRSDQPPGRSGPAAGLNWNRRAPGCFPLKSRHRVISVSGEGCCLREGHRDKRDDPSPATPLEG